MNWKVIARRTEWSACLGGKFNRIDLRASLVESLHFSFNFMKQVLAVFIASVWLTSSTQAQTLNQAIANTLTLPAPTPYAVVSRDANSALWQWETYEQAPDGSIVPHVHQYTELATGLNHLANGQWVTSKEEIDISSDGSSAAATNGQHQVYFPGNIYNGTINLVMPDGQTLQSQPIGLSYFDGTNSVLLATVTNSTGAILPSGNQVIYTNAFAGLNADLLYTYTKAGAEQDVILREQPPDPAVLDLNPATTRIQVLTEFFNPPQPVVTATTVPTAAGNLEDDYLSFGAMQMGHGKAFLIGDNSPSVGVNKRWVVLAGRQFLIEEVPIVSIATAIDSLPPYVAQARVGTKHIVSKNLILPPQRLTHTSPKTRFLAEAQPPRQGLVLDYVTMISQTNWVFQGDTTYYISGVVNLTGTNTFEGGTELKYATNATINITGINCLTAPYRPVYFTGKDDDRTGEWISGTTHNPTGYYANPALTITASGQTLSNFRIAYAQQGIATSAGSASFYNGQLVNCGFGLTASGTTNFLRNVLFSNVNTNFNNLSSAAVDVQNGSFGYSAYLASVGSAVTILVTNSVLAYVTNLYSGSPTNFTGGYNGFFNATEFGAGALTNNSYPFQTAGAGGYYMASGCIFTNAGTANIDPTLLANLANLTTYPPVVYSNQTISTNLILSPQAQRDTNSAPNLGYHYAPLDYVFGGVNVSSNITFIAGTAAGWFDLPGSNGSAGWGISLYGQIVAAFNGIVTAPCVWARYDTVQEGGNGLWVAKDTVGGIASYQYNSYNISNAPQVVLNFTHCAEMWGDPNHFRDYYTPLIVMAKNSEFWSGLLAGFNNSCYWTNCLVYRMTAGQDQGYNPSNAFVMRNCTWHGGQVYFTPNNNPILLSIRDSAFDGSTFITQNYGTNGDYDYNAYTNGAAQLTNSGIHDVIVTNFNWQASWFGSFYLPSNSSLTNAGDVPASQLGLYHFTILTNQVPEGTNTVSVGYHYVAADAYGNPLDSNGDGIPDYLEDANGNGIFDTGDLGDWQGLNLKVLITRPRNGSILP